MENKAILLILALIGIIFAAVILGIIQTKKEHTRRDDGALNEASKEPQEEAGINSPKEIPQLTSQTALPEDAPSSDSEEWVDMDILLLQHLIVVSRFNSFTEGLYIAIKRALEPIIADQPGFKNPPVFWDEISSVGELESITKVVEQCLVVGIGSYDASIHRNNEFKNVRRTCFTPGGIVQLKIVNLVLKESSTKFKTFGYTRDKTVVERKKLKIVPDSIDVSLYGDSDFSGSITFSESPSFLTCKNTTANNGNPFYLHEAEVEIKIDVPQSFDWEPCGSIPVPAITSNALGSLQELYDGDGTPVVETYFSEGCFVIQARLGKEIVLISDRSTMTVLQSVDPYFLLNTRKKVVIENSLLTHLLNDTSNHLPKVYDFVDAKIKLKEDEALNIRWFHNQ